MHVYYGPSLPTFNVCLILVLGGKGNTWEGGIRVPTIVKLPGIIPPGSVVSKPTHLPDVLPTVARVTGVKLPGDRVYDGHDLLPLLTNSNKRENTEFMFHYCGGFLNAVRYTPKGGMYNIIFCSSEILWASACHSLYMITRGLFDSIKYSEMYVM